MQRGRVASIHIHPEKSGAEMLSVEQIEVQAEKGIVQEKRYFGRRASNGQASKRQVTLIEREQIAEHAATLKCPAFPPGAVRSNIETDGINLVIKRQDPSDWECTAARRRTTRPVRENGSLDAWIACAHGGWSARRSRPGALLGNDSGWRRDSAAGKLRTRIRNASVRICR